MIFLHICAFCTLLYYYGCSSRFQFTAVVSGVRSDRSPHKLVNIGQSRRLSSHSTENRYNILWQRSTDRQYVKIWTPIYNCSVIVVFTCMSRWNRASYTIAAYSSDLRNQIINVIERSVGIIGEITGLFGSQDLF